MYSITQGWQAVARQVIGGEAFFFFSSKRIFVKAFMAFI